MTESAQSSREGKQRSFAALHHPGCRVYLLGTMLAMMADNIEHVISYWMIFQKFHSPALAGFAVISHWLPFLLFSIWAGALADRFDPRRVIQAGMVLFMVASAGWGYLFLTDSLEQWHAVVLLVIHGMAGVIWGPASQLMLHDIVGGANLQSAIRLMSTSRQLGLLMGPAIGGGILLALGPAWGILINAAIYLPLTLWLVSAPFGPKFRPAGASQPKKRAVRGFADIVDTIRMVAGNRVVISMTLLAGLSSFVVGNAHQAQMPEFAHDLGHGQEHGADLYYSILLTASAAGALLGGLVLEGKNLLPAKPRTAFLLVMLWCATIAGFALTDIYIAAVLLMMAAGFLNLSYSSMTQTLVQLHAPEDIRGRVIGLYNMSGHGMRAFSGFTVGFGGSLIGVHWSLALSAFALMVLTAGVFAVSFRGLAQGSASAAE